MVTIQIKDKKFSLSEICNALGVANARDVTIDLENEGKHISILTNDNDCYPSVMVMGKVEDRELNLAEIELPNPDFPEDFTLRVYAGNPAYETDAWIALVKSNAAGKSVVNKKFSARDELTKIIYVDDDLATAKSFDAFGDVPYNRLPEHLEDIN